MGAAKQRLLRARGWGLQGWRRALRGGLSWCFGTPGQDQRGLYGLCHVNLLPVLPQRCIKQQGAQEFWQQSSMLVGSGWKNAPTTNPPVLEDRG